jgi:hypothetical protein
VRAFLLQPAVSSLAGALIVAGCEDYGIPAVELDSYKDLFARAWLNK